MRVSSSIMTDVGMKNMITFGPGFAIKEGQVAIVNRLMGTDFPVLLITLC